MAVPEGGSCVEQAKAGRCVFPALGFGGPGGRGCGGSASFGVEWRMWRE